MPSEPALHLLELHWTRQHHTFHLIYRPRLMRDILAGGPYRSEFLLNASFACSSKSPERPEVQTDPLDPSTAGKVFFDHCDKLLAEKSLFTIPSVPTIARLAMLGGTFNARGQISKGWLYTVCEVRMLYDLNLHLKCSEGSEKSEEVKTRKRLFWGVFVCEKTLESLPETTVRYSVDAHTYLL